LLYIFEKKQMQSQYSEELLKIKLQTQEETLNWLGKELHDNIAQLLNSSKVLVGVAQRIEKSEETLAIANDTLDKAILEVRMLSKSLSREWLEQFSFGENIVAEAVRINATKEITMTIDCPEKIEMSRERQLILFRMVQEAFQNSLKHSGGTQIRITASQQEGNILVTVEDNGKGFSLDHEGFGMNSIKHRALLLGGMANWHSDSHGTSIRIQLPLAS
jgi:signal transduction histidine kinase